MDFRLTQEQQMIVDTTRTFTERELIPHEERVECEGEVSPDLVKQIKQRSISLHTIVQQLRPPQMDHSTPTAMVECIRLME
jgi:alkylation response protein AidB-like acyl-CoA dehydrogenase